MNFGQVSIIMPCYNSQKFIEDAIRSVLLQSYKNWELIIVDDCSNDNSMQIINQYQKNDNRIRVYITDSNSGCPAVPRNIAIKNSSGQYIAFLDSDDLWMPKKLEEQMKIFKSQRDVGVVFSNYELINEKGLRINKIIKSPEKVNYSMLLNSNYIGNLTAIYDILKIGRIYQKNIKNEDYLYWLEILRKGLYARNTNTNNALYRLHRHSFSANKFKVIKWQWQIYTKELKLKKLKASYYMMKYALLALRKHFL